MKALYGLAMHQCLATLVLYFHKRIGMYHSEMKPMRKTWIVITMIIMLLMISSVAAIGKPVLVINGNPVNLEENSVVLASTGGVDDNVERVYELAAPIVTDEYEIRNVVVTYKEDPYIAYGLAVIDTGAPTPFSFQFSEPIVPIVGANVVESSFSASTTDGGTNGVILTAIPPLGLSADGDGIPEIQMTTVSDGIVRDTIGLDLGPTATLPNPPSSSTVGPFNEGPIAGPVSATAWNNLQIDVNWEGSGGGDIYTMNGHSKIVQTPNIPEFPTMALPVALIIGLIGAVLFIKTTKEN